MSGGRELLVTWVGKHQRRAWEKICGRYRQRIERVMPIREIVVKAQTHKEGRQRLDAEGDAVLAALPEPCWIVALDVRGKLMTSETLAARLSRRWRDWPHPIAFVLGSDLGLGEPVRRAARSTLSLSPMTLSHELARTVLYEQLYRVASQMAGTGYHRG